MTFRPKPHQSAYLSPLARSRSLNFRMAGLGVRQSFAPQAAAGEWGLARPTRNRRQGWSGGG
jgi:hypothetical protein